MYRILLLNRPTPKLFFCGPGDVIEVQGSGETGVYSHEVVLVRKDHPQGNVPLFRGTLQECKDLMESAFCFKMAIIQENGTSRAEETND